MFSIRSLAPTQSDARALSLLHHICFPNDPWSEKTFLDYFTQDQWTGTMGFGAYLHTPHGHVVIGFILARSVEDTADILSIAVHPDYRTWGAGFTLLSSYLSACPPSITRCLLEVAIDNQPAIRLYTKAGFHTIAIRKNYYKTPHGLIDALIMEWVYNNKKGSTSP